MYSYSLRQIIIVCGWYIQPICKHDSFEKLKSILSQNGFNKSNSLDKPNIQTYNNPNYLNDTKITLITIDSNNLVVDILYYDTSK